MRGETPPDAELRKGEIRLIKPKKLKPVQFQKNKKTKKYGGGKVKYRSIGGKVTNGNDITRMVYD